MKEAAGVAQVDFLGPELKFSSASCALEYIDPKYTQARCAKICQKQFKIFQINHHVFFSHNPTPPVCDDITLCVSSDWLWTACHVISAGVLLADTAGHILFTADVITQAV